MRIPNAERAVIEPAKLHAYLLSRNHPIGRFKAAFFLANTYPRCHGGGADSLRTEVRDPRYAGWAIRELGGSGERLGCAYGRGVPPIRDGLSGGQQMTYRVLDTVVLDRDLPDHGLRKGDLGAVVEVYEPDGLEVEFVTASGRTAALLTLNARDVRPVGDDDLVSVRPCRRSA